MVVISSRLARGETKRKTELLILVHVTTAKPFTLSMLQIDLERITTGRPRDLSPPSAYFSVFGVPGRACSRRPVPIPVVGSFFTVSVETRAGGRLSSPHARRPIFQNPGLTCVSCRRAQE